jgi:hypothetical protein
MATLTTDLVHEDMSFQIRVWRSQAADGWFWTVRAEDHDYVKSGTRAWPNARLATEAAQRHLARTF